MLFSPLLQKKKTEYKNINIIEVFVALVHEHS
jgi:hypothetical protein